MEGMGYIRYNVLGKGGNSIERVSNCLVSKELGIYFLLCCDVTSVASVSLLRPQCPQHRSLFCPFFSPSTSRGRNKKLGNPFWEVVHPTASRLGLARRSHSRRDITAAVTSSFACVGRIVYEWHYVTAAHNAQDHESRYGTVVLIFEFI